MLRLRYIIRNESKNTSDQIRFFTTLIQPPKCKLTKEIHALDILYRLTNRHLLNTYSYPH